MFRNLIKTMAALAILSAPSVAMAQSTYPFVNGQSFPGQQMTTLLGNKLDVGSALLSSVPWSGSGFGFSSPPSAADVLSAIGALPATTPSASTAINVNGDFTWDQVNEGATLVAPTSLVTVIDAWNTDGPTSGLMTFQRGTRSVGSFPVVPPPGYATYERMSSVSAHVFAAGDHAQLKTQMSSTAVGFLNFGTAAAAPIALDYCLQANSSYTYPLKVPLFIDNNNQSGSPTYPSSRIYIHDVTLAAANTWYCGTTIVPGDTAAFWSSPTAKSPLSNTPNMSMVAGV
jgi:hypothetical protein